MTSKQPPRKVRNLCRLLSFTTWATVVALGTQGRATPKPPHPEPRVIVNVLSVQGPHVASEVQRSARLAWGRIVRCYKTHDRRARGVVQLEITIATRGVVTHARRIRSTLQNVDLADCLTATMKGLNMPSARSRSVANIEVRVAPGDPT